MRAPIAQYSLLRTEGKDFPLYCEILVCKDFIILIFERSQTSILATHSSLGGLKWFEIRDWKPFCLLHHQVATDLLNIAANVTLPSCCQCWEPQILPETFGDWCLTRVEISHVCRIWIDVDCHVRRRSESHHPTASHTHLMDSSGNPCF